MNPLIIAALLYTLDGGATHLQIPNMPFYHMGDQLTVTITHPTEGAYYYIDDQDINITYTGTPIFCEYRIDDNDWNTCDCANPLCGSARTFHGGENTLSVLVTDANGNTAMDTATFEVWLRIGAGSRLWWGVVIIVMGVVLIAVLDDDN